ncbi:MAG: nitrite reductase small subunit NirD [Burkholderiales bacterium]|nr:nitrite reductase small subunit NirD [Burkholderiales bacterium]
MNNLAKKVAMPTKPIKFEQWIEVGAISDIPKDGARVVKTPLGDIAVFRNLQDEVFALRDKCPHKGGPLSQGIIYGRTVACPLHNWSIALETGIAVAPDEGCAASFPIRLDGEKVFLSLTPSDGSADH